MRTSFERWGKLFQRVLFEVPGWPDAPKWVRFRRALPILLPAFLALALFAGSRLVHRPMMNLVRQDHASLLGMEAELADMRLEWSDQHAAEMEKHAQAITSRLLSSEQEVDGFLAGFREKFEALGWEYRYQTYDTSPAGTEGALGEYAPALVRLRMLDQNESPLAAILTATGSLKIAGPQVDVTRLSVTVGDTGETFVEINLRILCASKHAKISE